MVPKFCSPYPRGSPRWAEWPSPPCNSWGRGASVSQPSTSQKQTHPAHRGWGGKINATSEAKWRCYKCPAGPQGPAAMLCLTPPASPWQGPRVGNLRRAAATALPWAHQAWMATSPLGHRGPILVSSSNRVQRGKGQEKVQGTSRPSCPPWCWSAPARVPPGGSQAAHLLSVWFRKTSPERKPGSRQIQRQDGKKIFARCVCVHVSACVCVSISSGRCSCPQSFQKSPDAVPRAYKASFNTRKEAAVKTADGLALQGPELGLITLLLPGMMLVVS